MFCKFNRLKSTLILITYFFTCSAAFAQGAYAVTNQLEGVSYSTTVYDAANGLPTSDANYLLGSKAGYLWVGGYSGIFRYDGTNFERLPVSEGMTNGRALFEDSKNRIWVGTNDNGVVVIDGNRTLNYTYKDGLPSSSIRNFAEDKDGNVFIATTTGLAFVRPNGLLYPVTDPHLDKERILKLDSDSQGKIYGQTSNGIVFAVQNRNLTEMYNSADLDMPLITSILADPFNPGKVYLCTEGGLIYYGDFGKKASSLETIDISPIKTVQWISYECGRIWLCSTSQLAYLDTKNQLNLVENIPVSNKIEMFTSDYQGNLWLCSSTQGVMKIVANNFYNITKETKLSRKTTNAACFHKGLLYIGSDEGLFILDENYREIKNQLTAYIADSRIRCIVEDNENNLWISTFTNDLGLVCLTDDGKIKNLTTKDGLPNNKVRTVKLAEDGSLLCGTNGGLAIIKNGKVIQTYTSDTNDIIKNSVFLTVEETSDGKILAGSDGDGIYEISASGISHLSRDQGITSDVVMKIKEDRKHGVIWLVTSNSLQYIKNGQIKKLTSFPYNNNYDIYLNDNDEFWVLSSAGIFSVNADELLNNKVSDYRFFGVDNGLSSPITSNSYCAKDDNGNLFLCCRDGVTRVNMNNYSINKISIKTELSSVMCGNQTIQPNEKGQYIIPSSTERIKFSASVMDFAMTNPIVRVFLEGSKDEGLTVPRNELTPLEYTELSYGNYTFHIQLLSQNKKDILLDKTYEIVKRPRFSELLFIRVLMVSILVIIAGFIIWTILRSTLISSQFKQVRNAKEEAELANATKSRFLANMSQEILTPLNTILCMDEMILRENASNVPKNYFLSMANYGMNIHEAAESLLNLINDLLEMTKIESGRLTVSETEYDVKEVLRSLIIPLRKKAEEKGLKFSVSIDEMIPSRLCGDVGKIKQILINLLTNSIKYTNQGEVALFISMESRTNDICDLCIRVKDTGIGMSPEILENIFQAYSAFEKESKGFHFKTGLGLDISRRFAELMGGVLVCKSEEGKGSEFICTLSQKIVNAYPLGIFTEQQSVTARGPYTPEFIAPDADVLVASANPVIVNVTESLLKATKVFVANADSKQGLISKIKEASYNIVFIDELLFNNDEAEMEEILSRIKSMNEKLPLYVFTENASSSEDYYKQKGFAGTLSLPVDSGLLERTIMKHLPEEMMQLPDLSFSIMDLPEMPENMKWLYETEGLSVEDGIKTYGGIGSYLFGLSLFYETIDENARIIEEAYNKGEYTVFRVRNSIIRNSARLIGALSLFSLSTKIEEAFARDDKLFVAANVEALLNEYRAFKDKLAGLNEGVKNV